METKELNIVAPQGYEIDKENSTFECIKFKKIEQKKWRDNTNAKINGYYIGLNCNILQTKDEYYNTESNHNIFATKKQAESALAMARISQIMANDERFGGVITDKEWCDTDYKKFVIRRAGDKWARDFFTSHYHFLAFHTGKQMNLFLQENEDLVKDYLMID